MHCYTMYAMYTMLVTIFLMRHNDLYGMAYLDWPHAEHHANHVGDFHCNPNQP